MSTLISAQLKVFSQFFLAFPPNIYLITVHSLLSHFAFIVLLVGIYYAFIIHQIGESLKEVAFGGAGDATFPG